MAASRTGISLALAGVLFAFLVAGSASGAQAKATNITARNAIELPTIKRINALRKKHGLRPLKVTRSLGKAARAHARSMARKGYFSHTSANGTVFWKRIQKWYGSAGYKKWQVGENLLWASPDVTPKRAVEMWLDSPPHRAVLLNPAWRQIGLQAVRAKDAPGVFGGRNVTIVAAAFGARR